MDRPYKAFKENRIGKRIDYDGAYGIQCVDLIKQYADEVLGLGKIGSIGNLLHLRAIWLYFSDFIQEKVQMGFDLFLFMFFDVSAYESDYNYNSAYTNPSCGFL